MPRRMLSPSSKDKSADIPESMLQLLAVEDARLTGKLPHEWLLEIVRGMPVPQKRWRDVHDGKGKVLRQELIEELVYPDTSTRIDVAKAVAPYYAPRLSTQVVTQTTQNFAVDVTAIAAMTKEERRTMLVLLKKAGVNLEVLS